MKKLLAKIIGATTALAMVIGVGIGIGLNMNRTPSPVHADSATKTYTPTSANNVTASNSFPFDISYTNASWSSSQVRLTASGTITFSAGSSYTNITSIDSIAIVFTSAGYAAAGSANNSYTTALNSLTTTITKGATNATSVTWSSGAAVRVKTASVDSFTITYTTSGAAPTTYTVTYDANGGTGTMTDSNSPYTSGATVTVLNNTFTRDGYSFDHWNTENNNNGTNYDEGDSFAIAANTTLYAQWIVAAPATYSVTYNANGGVGSVPEDNTAYNNGDSVSVLGNSGNLTKEDYTFGGWTDSEHNYDEGDTFEITSDVTLTAIWNLDNGVDVLNKSFTGASSGYINWSNKTGSSGAVYAGNSAGGNDSIQLRSDNSNSGIIATTSAGNIKKVYVVWQGDTANGRTLNVYGKDTAYSAATDLYSAGTQGTLIGTIVKGTSTTLEINDDYRYVGIRSNSGAMYLSELHFKWEEVPLNPRVTLSPSSLDLKTNQQNGLTVTALVEDVANPTYSWVRNNESVILENASTATVTIKPNINVAGNSSVTVTIGGTNPELTATVTVSISIPEPGETPETAYSVAEAKAAIDAASEDVANVYITGKISQIDEISLPNKNATYWISDDGTTTEQFKIYRGKYVDNANFTSEDQIMEGDLVVVFGTISKQHSSLNQGNYIVSLTTIRVNSITLTPSTINIEPEATGDIVDLFTNIVINQDDGSNKNINDIVWSSDDENVLCLIGDKYLAGSTHRTSTTIRASIGGREYGHATVNVIDSSIHFIPYNSITWTKVTSLAIGDTIVFTYESTSKEMTGVESVGTVGDYSGNPNGTYLLTVEAGNGGTGYSFKTQNNTYLSWTSGNSLATSADKNNSSSWTINTNSNGNWKFANASDASRLLQYNSGSPRFACYTSNQSAFQIYKKTTESSLIDLPSLKTTATIHGTETIEQGNLVVNNVAMRFGLSVAKSEWDAVAAVATISDYGVMLMKKSVLGNSTIENAYTSNPSSSDIKKFNKCNNEAPYADPEVVDGKYVFTVKVNFNDSQYYNHVICAVPYIVVNGTYYFFTQKEESVKSLAEYYYGEGLSELSDDALEILAA